MNRLSKIVEDKIVCIAMHGKSLEELEDRIEDFNSDKICWASCNAFDIVEDYILSKINKKLDIIGCFAEYFPEIEKEVRIPALIKALDNGSFVLAQEYLFTKTFPENGYGELLSKYISQILIIKSLARLLKQDRVSSLGFMLCALSIAGAKDIILFGCDGIGPEVTDYLGTYYKSDIHIKRRVLPRFKGVKVRDGYFSSVQSDTIHFNNNFNDYYSRCLRQFKVFTTPKISNCSMSSVITNFKKIFYDEAVNICQ